MRDTLQEIVSLQEQYSAEATDAMKRRGRMVRNDLPNALEAHGDQLRGLLGAYGDDARAEGKDNQGQMSRIPWARWYSASRSPSATTGWYLVYLFHPDASGVSLCLSHGSTEIVGSGFVNRTDAEVARLMTWASGILGPEFEGDPNIRLGVSLGTFDLARGYERTTVASRFYPSGQIPPDEALIADLVRFMGPLAKLYRAAEMGLSPGSISQDLLQQVTDVERVVSPLKTTKGGQGRGLSGPLRKLVELHAMARARDWLASEGFTYQDVSTTESCDFRAQRDGREWVIEVKGTTGGPGSVLLTRNEVTLHRSSFPQNALLVVHGIDLPEGSTSPTGGELLALAPWKVEEDRLSPVCFEYRLPAM